MSKASIRRRRHAEHGKRRRPQRTGRPAHWLAARTTISRISADGAGGPAILDVGRVVDAQLEAEGHPRPHSPTRKMGKPGYGYGSETMLIFLVAASAKLREQGHDFDPDGRFADDALAMVLHELKLAIGGRIER